MLKFIFDKQPIKRPQNEKRRLKSIPILNATNHKLINIHVAALVGVKRRRRKRFLAFLCCVGQLFAIKQKRLRLKARRFEWIRKVFEKKKCFNVKRSCRERKGRWSIETVDLLTVAIQALLRNAIWLSNNLTPAAAIESETFYCRLFVDSRLFFGFFVILNSDQVSNKKQLKKQTKLFRLS